MIEVQKFDGYLINYTQLCEEAGLGDLEKNEENLKALAAACYRMWGKDMFTHLDGGFFLAIHDRSSDEYVIGRDRFGIRSGYYVSREGTPFCFGTSAVEVLSAAGLKAELDMKSLQLYLTFSFVPGPGTMFAGVSKLMPGQYIVYGQGQMKKVQYWMPVYEAKGGVSLAEWERQLDEVLRRSVSGLPLDEHTHALLSSGVDSAYLAAISGIKRTHTACFSSSFFHEEDGAQRTAEVLGIENTLHVIDTDRYLESIPELLTCLEEPCGDASEPVLYLLCRELPADCRAVLSAEGIDELFGGYHICRTSLRKASYWKLPRWFRRFAAVIGDRFPCIPGRWLMMTGERDISEFPGNTLVFGKRGVRRILKGKLPEADPYETVRECCGSGDGMDMITTICDHDLRLVFCWGILQSIDRISRATGIRFYLPFVSKQVFDTAAAIPSRFKVTENTGKLVFRRTAMRTLPEEICSRRKIGFETPVSRWLQQKEFADQVRAAFRTSEGARFFRRKELDRIWKGFERKPAKYWRQIWTIYMFLRWYDVFAQ